jgi:hypothetical protein
MVLINPMMSGMDRATASGTFLALKPSRTWKANQVNEPNLPLVD